MMEDIYVDINSLSRPQLTEGHKGVKSKMATKMATISLHTCFFQNRLKGLIKTDQQD